MNYRIDVMRRPADHVVCVRASAPPDEIGTAIGGAIEKSLIRAAEAGLQPSGPPEVMYLGDFAPGTGTPARIGVDLPVSGPVDTMPEVRQRPECQVARAVHRGPYDSVGAAHRALAEWARVKGYRVIGPPTEVYLAGPETDRAPGDYLTEVLLPVAG